MSKTSNTSTQLEHPYDYYHKVGDALRPAPAKVRYTHSYTHVRRLLLKGFRDVKDFNLPDTQGKFEQYAAHYNDRYWEGDQLMDNLVQVFKQLPSGQGRRIFEQALELGIDSLDSPPAELQALFNQLDHVPEWVDWNLINEGSDAFSRISPLGYILGASVDTLMTTNNTSTSKMVGTTGRFERERANRFIETLAFTVSVAKPKGLLRFSDGFKHTVRVRLMHAQVRARVSTKHELVDFANCGNPISCSDTAGGIPLFGIVFALSDIAMGGHYSTRELEALTMQWSYMGYILGADEEIIPKTLDRNLFLIDYVLAIAGPPSVFSDRLNHSFFQGIKEQIIERSDNTHYQKGVRVGYHFIYAFLWYLFGKQLGKELKHVNPVPYLFWVPYAYKWINSLISVKYVFSNKAKGKEIKRGHIHYYHKLLPSLGKLFAATNEEKNISFDKHDILETQDLIDR